uniref:Uncharacterized protein n=1 Tax=Rhizophora mucronata TaxID=61149 RepID=A0A2P2QE45_RHIMU
MQASEFFMIAYNKLSKNKKSRYFSDIRKIVSRLADFRGGQKRKCGNVCPEKT